MTYKPLKTSFKKNTFNFIQIKRIKDVALYSKAKDGGVTTYEVIIVQKHDEYKMGGILIEAAECFPSNESWGTFGWTYTTLKDAEETFNNLLKN